MPPFRALVMDLENDPQVAQKVAQICSAKFAIQTWQSLFRGTYARLDYAR